MRLAVPCRLHGTQRKATEIASRSASTNLLSSVHIPRNPKPLAVHGLAKLDDVAGGQTMEMDPRTFLR